MKHKCWCQRRNINTCVVIPFSFQNIYTAALPHMLGKMLHTALWIGSRVQIHSYVQTCVQVRTFWPLVSIIIPKQTIINEPCDAYLSERRQPPPPLPLGWGCHGDRFIDIWGERRRRAGLEGWGCRGEVEGVGTGLRTLVLCLSDVSLCFICQSSIRVSLSSVKEQFMNFSQSSLCQAPSWL